MKCRTCEMEYHYCSSCGSDGFSELGFCSFACLYTYRDALSFEITNRVLDLHLTAEQKKGIYNILRSLKKEGMQEYETEIIELAFERLLYDGK